MLWILKSGELGLGNWMHSRGLLLFNPTLSFKCWQQNVPLRSMHMHIIYIPLFLFAFPICFHKSNGIMLTHLLFLIHKKAHSIPLSQSLKLFLLINFILFLIPLSMHAICNTYSLVISFLLIKKKKKKKKASLFLWYHS